jgi:hypothetical protein
MQSHSSVKKVNIKIADTENWKNWIVTQPSEQEN